MAFEIAYSGLDRLIHRLAFASPAVQLTAAEIEAALFGGDYNDVASGSPIFITALPRAGTTLLLSALSRFPSLAAQTYRDMPFVLAPVLWSRLGGAFRRADAARERAHGDGMAVGYDSPEAFEEVFWLSFWPEKYRADRIELWGKETPNAEAVAFLRAHMRKVVALRRPGSAGGARYLSKNNANIARLDLLAAQWPDARILVPLRRPAAQAASLWRQQGNFAELFRRDPFARRYVADLGHYEFADLHRPIDFPGLDELIAGRRPEEPDYWLAYWIAAYEHIGARRDALVLLGYEAACRDARRALISLCEALAIDAGEIPEAAVSLFHPDAAAEDLAPFDPGLLRRAEALHADLHSGCV